MNSPPEPRIVDWAGLPDDLLTCVYQPLNVPDRICFRAVCRSWRAADVQDQQRELLMPPPWVVIPADVGCSKSFTLLSIPTMQSFRWTPPGGLGLHCVGSSGGWLAGAYIHADRTVRISLLNPLTDACIEVPAASATPVGYMPRFSLLDLDHNYRVDLALSNAVQKVAFSPNPTEQDFAVAVVTPSLVPGSFVVAFARAGCKSWCAFAKLPVVPSNLSRLDVAYHDGKFYYMTMCGQVWVVDMAAPSPSPAPLARFVPSMPSRNCHLAFSGDGALHLVWSTSDLAHLSMLALRYDPKPSQASWPWTEARLHGEAFLVGDFNQTLCVPTDGKGAWLRPDSVYFISIPCGHGGVWLFDLATRYIGRPAYFRRRRLKSKRRPLDFRRLTWSWNDEENSATVETWNWREFRLDWSKAIWFMPSRR